MNSRTEHVESEYRPFNFETQSTGHLSDQSQSTAVGQEFPPRHISQQQSQSQSQSQHPHARTDGGERERRREEEGPLAPPPPYSTFTSQLPATPSPRRAGETDIPFAPTPPYSSTADDSYSTSGSDLYGPDRLFGPPLVVAPPPAFAAGLPPASALPFQQPQQQNPNLLSPEYRRGQVQYYPPQPYHQQLQYQPPQQPPTTGPLHPAPVALPATTYRRNPRFVHFNEAEMAAREAAMNQAQLTGFRDELVREAGIVTPGIDDTPYLQYALDAITKEPGDYGNTDSNGATNIPRTPHVSGESYSYPSPHPIYRRGSEQTRERDPRQRTVARDENLMPAESEKQRSAWEEKPAVGTAVINTAADDGQATNRESGMHTVPITPGGVEALEPPRRPSSPAGTLTPDPRVKDEELPGRDAWTPVEPWHRPHVLPLEYKPLLLRTPILLVSAVLPLILVAFIIFVAVHSAKHTGLVDYSGTIYGGQWFLFRLLPQLCALAVILLAQGVVGTAYRVQPFRMLSSATDDVRQGAFVRDVFAKTFLWPKIDEGTWDINVPVVLLWIGHFVIPLSSGLFSVVLEDDQWRWATVQGVAWTLAALYLLLTAMFIVLFVAWRRAETGLLWDPRSLADLVGLFSRTNNTAAFDGLDGAGAGKREFAYQLGGAADRLSWWHDRNQPRGGRWWYSLGLSANSHPVRNAGGLPSFHVKRTKYQSSNETLHDEKGAAAVGARAGTSASKAAWFLPWYLRTGPLLCFIVAAGLVLIAIFVVSFITGTSLSGGFLPGVDAAPNVGAFSGANFLWSFFPSFLGLLLWLLWLGLEHRIRVLTPWAELSKPEGAPASKCLLVDYAATAFPIMVTFKAAKAGHWRVAATSLLSSLFAFLPVLGGGLFMALTNARTFVVKMYPNFPAYGVLLALLVLYFLGLVSLIPDRERMRLPHAIDSLGEIYSFCVSQEFLSDSAFRTSADFDNRGQFTGKEKRRMMIEELVKGKGEKRFAFVREGGRWGVQAVRRFTGGENLGMARRMREQMRMRVQGQEQGLGPDFWARGELEGGDAAARMV